MREVLNKYKERLINISSRNRSLSMKKLYKKSSFDLYRLNKFVQGIEYEILDLLINNKSSKVKIIPDQYRLQEETLENYMNEKNINIKKELILLKEKTEADWELEEKAQYIRQKHEQELLIKTEKLGKQLEEIIQYSQSLSYLNREINAIEKETGRYELYVGYPFVEGYFKDKTFVKAPLLLFPVKIKKEGDNWYLENLEEQNVLLNKVFIMAFSKYNGIKLNDIDTEFESLSEAGLDTLEGLLKYLEENHITIKNKGDVKVERFVEQSSDGTVNYSAGELVLKKYLILGRFPIASNSIYNDYLALEKQNCNNELLDRLLLNSEKTDSEADEIEDNRNMSIKEEDFYFMTPLDFSQEKAVKMVNNTEQLVVYGPPGTGKSQTIASIISDGLAKGKKILMVSQKRAALDVIFNRISNLNAKVVLIHDGEKDKKAFYEKVANSLEELYLKDIIQITSEINDKSRNIDEKLKVLDRLGEILHSERAFGLSLQQMYSKSKRITSKEDPRYEDFKVFRNINIFKGTTYKQITAAAEEVLNKGLAETYYNYRQCLSDNEVIIKLREDLDSFDIEDSLDSIEQIFDRQEASIRLEVEESTYLEPLIQLYIDKKGKLTETELAELSSRLNNEINKELLKKLNDNRWWSIPYWLKYSTNKKQEEENNKEFIRRGSEIGEDLNLLNGNIKAFIEKLNFIKDLLLEKEKENLLKLILSRKPVNEYLKKIKAALNLYNDFRGIVTGLSRLTELQSEVLKYSYNNGKDKEHYYRLIKILPEFLILTEINAVENDERAELDRYRDFSILQDDINKAIKEKQKLIPEFIIKHWDNRLFNSMNANKSKEKEMKRQAIKKRALWPLRKYLGEFNEVLFDLFPCWLLSPETVSEIMPLIEGLFDMIIFDEASQMFVENAIPAIYRSKGIVVAGDDKQLRPSSAFKVKMEEDEEVEDIETAAALEEESLLDLAKVNYDYVYLNVHYRSKYEELINFSNYAFYNGRLEISPNLLRSDDKGERAIERIKVEGTWIDRKNKEEAEKVVELVEHILKNRKDNETIGIITFNVNQKDLIDDMLEYRANEDREFKNLYNSELQRVDGNEDMSLFAKNIENVQGDERDIIIFSTAYAKNESGRVLVTFGSLSQDGGENRLNVAVSRAKKKIYVVTSIEPEELKIESSKNNGPKLFKKYLQYVRAASEGNKEEVDTVLNSFVDSEVSRNTVKDFDSDFEIEVYERLKELGYEVDTQVGVSGYRIDLAIYDKSTSRYVLGIECDGAAYYSSKYARERDIHRQRYLESRGWKIVRVWSKDWWNDWRREIEKIDKILN